MNDNPDAGSGSRGQQDAAGMSEEDVRALMDQMRSAPAEQIVSDVFSLVLNAASIKLGRRDARLFIDLASAMVECARPHISEELGKHVDDTLGRLRLEQVTAEQREAQGEPEPNDIERIPKPPAAAGSTEEISSPSTSKLWVPGR